ncbi:DUF2313 domain-containing protein [Sphingomonas gilva]|uniref:DUF2313 domain-containing protein n=1 Tax=Sphingomonas gilva TaxID=2305907 RepID=A0A396RLI6_9SPHN|nr:putative phage tail protein [Sphingomonas gilva]RHW17214.1 DUF2313 domain-containing protein [Sphingomonas gilva]
MNRDAAAYHDMLLALLPPGAAWPRDPGSRLGRLLGAEADGLARADIRSLALVEEADPRTALELLPDWERVAGLPDACAGAPDAISERQIALHAKIAERGGQSIPFFTEIAARLGYYVEITEFTSLDAGFLAGDDANGEDWRHTWRVEIFIGADDYRAGFAEFCAGSSAGDRLIGFGALDLECLIQRAAPAHTIVLFAYHVEPTPEFYHSFI